MLDSITKTKIGYMLDRHPIDTKFTISCEMIHGVFPNMSLKAKNDETFIFVPIGIEATEISAEVSKMIVDKGRKKPIVDFH